MCNLDPGKVPAEILRRRSTPYIPPGGLYDMKQYKLPNEVKESLWLEETRAGWSLGSIARKARVSDRRVQVGVTRARLRELSTAERLRLALTRGPGDVAGSPRPTLPRLVPLFPIGPLTPSSTCGHHGPIRPGSVFCCMVCHASGHDDHPSLKIESGETSRDESTESDSPIRSDTRQPPPNGCQTPPTVSRGRLPGVQIDT